MACEDCEEEMQRRFLDEHMSSECSNRIVQCEYCEDEFRFWRTEVSHFLIHHNVTDDLIYVN